MAFAARNFNARQALEKEIKTLFARLDIGTPTAPTAVLNLTADVTLTKASVGTVENSGTVTIQVAAAAANPSDEVLVDVTGTAAAIVITVTPNDGTNNTATPVDLTTAELAELLDSGTVVGKTVTVTDAGSLLANIASAAGGGATALANGGEGDGVSASWSGAVDDLADGSVIGISEVRRNDLGDYSIILAQPFYALKSFKAIVLASSAADHTIQLKSEAVSTSGAAEVRFLVLTAGSPADPADGSKILIKLQVKNSSVRA